MNPGIILKPKVGVVVNQGKIACKSGKSLDMPVKPGQLWRSEGTADRPVGVKMREFSQ